VAHPGCRELFRFELEPGLVGAIGRSIKGIFSFAEARFAAEFATALGRKMGAFLL
jgi:hypothetical protein